MFLSKNIRLDFKTAIAVPRWAFHFYIRYFPVIAGISIIPSLERFLLINYQPTWPTWALVTLEVLVESVRILLLWWIIRKAITHDQLIIGLKRGEKWNRIKVFVKHRWRNLIFQLLLMLLASLIFDVFLERVIGGLINDNERHRYMALLLAIKNPTVIAWVMVWLVGIPRQMLRYAPEASRTGRYISMDDM